MQVPQGVHDALPAYSSQRPATEGDVEAATWEIDTLEVCFDDLDAGSDIAEPPPRLCDCFGVGIKGEHLGRLTRRDFGETTSAATDVEDTPAAEVGDPGDRSCFGAFDVTRPHAPSRFYTKPTPAGGGSGLCGKPPRGAPVLYSLGATSFGPLG